MTIRYGCAPPPGTHASCPSTHFPSFAATHASPSAAFPAVAHAFPAHVHAASLTTNNGTDVYPEPCELIAMLTIAPPADAVMVASNPDPAPPVAERGMPVVRRCGHPGQFVHCLISNLKLGCIGSEVTCGAANRRSAQNLDARDVSRCSPPDATDILWAVTVAALARAIRCSSRQGYGRV